MEHNHSNQSFNPQPLSMVQAKLYGVWVNARFRGRAAPNGMFLVEFSDDGWFWLISEIRPLQSNDQPTGN